MSQRGFSIPAAVVAALATAIPAASAAELAAEGQVPGSQVMVRELKRDAAATVTLRFQVVNGGSEAFKTYGLLGEYYAMDRVSLVDTANKKKYLAVKDSEGVCLCSELKAEIEPGAAVNLWAKFPAPPATVTAITVLVPGFEPIEAVPIIAAP